MNPIVQGTTGSAVEDIQERLTKLGYVIDQAELTHSARLQLWLLLNFAYPRSFLLPMR